MIILILGSEKNIFVGRGLAAALQRSDRLVKGRGDGRPEEGDGRREDGDRRREKERED